MRYCAVCESSFAEPEPRAIKELSERMITDATFWLQSPEARDEQVPSLDPHCMVCGQSLEGKPFFWELYMGPQLDIAGMHLRCAYFHSLRVLNEIASNDTGAHRTPPPRTTYTEQSTSDDVSDDSDDAIFEVTEDTDDSEDSEPVEPVEDDPQPIRATYPPEAPKM